MRLTILAVALALTGLACDETTKNPNTSAVAPAPQPTLQEKMGSPAAAAAPTPAQPQPQAAADVGSGFPTVPDGAQYTLYCMSISTPTHVADANRVRDALVRRTHSKDWYVLHTESDSKIYYGFYKTYDNDQMPEEKARAQKDRETIKDMKDDNGDKPFEQCAFEELASSDPSAPPEWELTHATGYWALQIAAYRGSPERKKYAVDAVREARAKGVPAYYYHGPAVSSVLIGTWPREAVKEQDKNEAKTDEPGTVPMILSDPLEAGKRTDNIYTADGKHVKVLMPRVEPRDPTLLEAMRDYPYNAVNGDVIYHDVKTKTGEVVKQPDPSFLVVIPHKEDEATAADTGARAGRAQESPPAQGSPEGFPAVRPPESVRPDGGNISGG